MAVQLQQRSTFIHTELMSNLREFEKLFEGGRYLPEGGAQSVDDGSMLAAEGFFERCPKILPWVVALDDARHEQQPLVTPLEHTGNQRFAVLQIGVAELEDICQCVGKLGRGGAAEVRHGALGGESEERLGVFGGSEFAAKPG